GPYVAMLALNAIDFMDERAVPLKEEIEKLPTKGDWVPSRGNAYVGNLIGKILDDLKTGS
ncbi:hypothetical protein N8590_03820, partial [bacterium]|nr:hypothetical protein [bacterium]